MWKSIDFQEKAKSTILLFIDVTSHRMEEYTDKLRSRTKGKSPHAETQRRRHRPRAPDIQLRSDKAADGKPRPTHVHHGRQGSQGHQEEESSLMVDTQKYLNHAAIIIVLYPVSKSHYEVRHQKGSPTDPLLTSS